MQMQEETIDQILSNIFTDVNIKRKITDELHQLTKSLIRFKVHSQYQKLYIKIFLDSTGYAFKLMSQKIVFDLVIKKAYPISPIRVYLKTQLFQPYINDIRDLFQQIMNKQWEYTDKIISIVEKIPKFLTTLKTQMHKILNIQKLGRYYLGEAFLLDQLKLFKSMDHFEAFKMEDQHIYMNYICVSQTHILIFLPDRQPHFTSNKLSIPKINKLYLNFYAETQCISQIKISKEEPSQIVFSLKSYKQRKMSLQPVYLKYNYRIVNAKGFINKILRTVTKFQNISIDYQSSKKDDLAKIMEGIKRAEDNLAHYLNKQNINLLNTKYQQAVQYLSGNNSPYYQIFLNKIARLFNREDVKLVSQLKIS